MPNFTTEFKVFVVAALLIGALGALFYNQFALSDGQRKLSERVDTLELHPSAVPTVEPTASPSATVVPTKLPPRFVSPGQATKSAAQ